MNSISLIHIHDVSDENIIYNNLNCAIYHFYDIGLLEHNNYSYWSTYDVYCNGLSNKGDFFIKYLNMIPGVEKIIIRKISSTKEELMIYYNSFILKDDLLLQCVDALSNFDSDVFKQLVRIVYHSEAVKRYKFLCYPRIKEYNDINSFNFSYSVNNLLLKSKCDITMNLSDIRRNNVSHVLYALTRNGKKIYNTFCYYLFNNRELDALIYSIVISRFSIHCIFSTYNNLVLYCSNFHNAFIQRLKDQNVYIFFLANFNYSNI